MILLIDQILKWCVSNAFKRWNISPLHSTIKNGLQSLQSGEESYTSNIDQHGKGLDLVQQPPTKINELWETFKEHDHVGEYLLDFDR